MKNLKPFFFKKKKKKKRLGVGPSSSSLLSSLERKWVVERA
jgi:hypothetical protein